MDYKPYSTEWNRKRYLKEALDNYLDDYVDNELIFKDIADILSKRSEKAYEEFSKINSLEKMLHFK
jgi:hypothetical protein